MDFLGNIVWHTLGSDSRFSRTQLIELLQNLELDLKVPGEPSATNIFKRAIKTFDFLEVDEEGTKNIYTLEKAFENDNTVIAQLHLKQTNKRLGINLVDLKYEFKFDKLTNEFETTYIGDRIHDMIRQHLLFSLEDEVSSLDHLAIRNMVRTYLEDELNGLWLKSGTYFVENEYTETLNKIKSLFTMLGPSESSIEVIPLVDSEEQRAMVSNAFLSKLFTEVGEFNLEVKALSDKPTAYQIKKLNRNLESIKAREEQANKLLNETYCFTDATEKSFNNFLEALNKD